MHGQNRINLLELLKELQKRKRRARAVFDSYISIVNQIRVISMDSAPTGLVTRAYTRSARCRRVPAAS